MINKFKAYDTIYFLGVFLLQIRFFDAYSRLITINSSLTKLFLLIGSLCIVIKILSVREKMSIYFLKVCMILLGVITYIKSKNTLFLVFILVILGAKDINKRAVIKYLFITNLLYVLINVFEYLTRMIFNPSTLNLIYIVKNDQTVKRYTFNFIHSNTFAAFIFWIYMMYIYLYEHKRNNYINICITLIVAIFIYFSTYSYTTSLMLVIFIILHYFYEKSKIFYSKVSKFILKNFIIIMCLIMLGTIIFYDSSLVQIIDNLMTNRVRLARFAYEYYGIGIFGTNILPIYHSVTIGDFIMGSFEYLDGGYYNLMLRSGILATCVFLYYTKKALSRLFKNKQNKEIIFLIICAIFSISETIAFDPLITFPLIFIFDSKKRSEEID